MTSIFQNSYVTGFLQLLLGVAIILFNDAFAPSPIWVLHLKPVLLLGTSIIFFGLAQIVSRNHLRLAKYMSLLAVATAVAFVMLLVADVVY